MTTTSDHAPGVSYGDFAWQDRPNLAPQTGHGVYVCGEITSYPRVDEEEGEVGQERHVLVHGFDLRVPQRGAEPVTWHIFWPTCTAHDEIPRWMDLVRPGRRLEGRLEAYDTTRALDEAGHLRDGFGSILYDVRVFVPQGEEA
jgi:hypothetical protein